MIVSFTSSDLVAGVLSIEHSLGVNYRLSGVYDNNGKVVVPTSVDAVDENNVDIDLSDFTVSGIWKAVIL